MRDELYRPLGQNLKTPTAIGWRRKAPSLIGWSTALILVAGSAYTLWSQPGFAPVGLAEPTEDAVPALVADARLPAAPTPTIVRMNQDGGVTMTGGDTQPTQSDANPYTGSIRVLEPGSLRQPAAFSHLPEEALVEPSEYGPLPVRATDGRRPLDVYAGASSGALGTRIAIVVGGLGISQTSTQQAIQRLPAGVTLAFAASGNSLDRWMQSARRDGHELLLQAPLEPFGYPEVSPGEHTLTVADAAGGRFEALDWALGRITNYVGVMNFMGARFNADPAALQPFLAEVSRRGLLYFDDGTSSRSQSRDVAIASGAPFVGSDLLLDDERTTEAIRRQLDALERVARAKGTAVGVASAFEVSIDAIAQWAMEAQGRGIEIVPVSTLAFDPEARS